MDVRMSANSDNVRVVQNDRVVVHVWVDADNVVHVAHDDSVRVASHVPR